LVHKLHGLEFVNSAHNVVLVGGPGTGKTHLATSLGVQATHQTTTGKSPERRSQSPRADRLIHNQLNKTSLKPVAQYST
jgi:chromosomal replication initiation ATPase DnaA